MELRQPGSLLLLLLLPSLLTVGLQRGTLATTRCPLWGHYTVPPSIICLAYAVLLHCCLHSCGLLPGKQWRQWVCIVIGNQQFGTAVLCMHQVVVV